jgi:hypothetical protein
MLGVTLGRHINAWLSLLSLFCLSVHRACLFIITIHSSTSIYYRNKHKHHRLFLYSSKYICFIPSSSNQQQNPPIRSLGPLPAVFETVPDAPIANNHLFRPLEGRHHEQLHRNGWLADAETADAIRRGLLR